MERKHDIVRYRGRLDKTLASHDLANEETIKALVKNQILRSSRCGIDENIESISEKRTKEVSNLLRMLRSASETDNEGSKSIEAPRGGWKVKQDTQEYRVMYREGPEGTPFHTLLVEGYVNGPIDVCLCISMESDLYKKWWPQFSVPTFKVMSSECLHKVRIGEQISLVRMKVSWPLSSREAVVHYFAFEYFQDDLIIVLLKSVSDLESINRSTHGFTKDGIPDAKDVVRIDVVGGFAVQKVATDRSYFRTIANMDMKLDFVPPAFINFISRQLIGSGFKLYQKEVASVAKGDEDFGKALKDPLYTRIREALYSDNISKGALEPADLKSDTCILPEEDSMKTMQAEGMNVNEEVLSNDHATHSAPEAAVSNQKVLGEIEEIEEEEIEECGSLEQDSKQLYKPTTNQILEMHRVYNRNGIFISPEVERALGTLEKAISIVREYGSNPKSRSLPGFTSEKFLNLEKDAEKDLKSSEDGQICSNGEVCIELSKDESMEMTSCEPRNSSCSYGSRYTRSNSYTREANHNRIAPASPEEDIPNPTETHQTALRCSIEETTEAVAVENVINRDKLVNNDANGTDENNLTIRKSKKPRFCCLHFISGLLIA